MKTWYSTGEGAMGEGLDEDLVLHGGGAILEIGVGGLLIILRLSYKSLKPPRNIKIKIRCQSMQPALPCDVCERACMCDGVCTGVSDCVGVLFDGVMV